MARIEQAGGIAVRRESGETRVLLVKAKKDPTLWIFPKGHIEKGETAAEAALRETQEEGGVDGEVVGPIGEPLEFESGREAVRVQYFLIRATSDADSPERREKGWFTVADALARLRFENSQALLKDGAAAARRLFHGK